MTYIVRFNDTKRDDACTHLTVVHGEYRVGHHAGGGQRVSYTADEATTYPNEAAAYEALGRFIADRGLLTDKCWISSPQVIPYTPPPVRLATSSIGGAEVTLTKEGGKYVLRSGALCRLEYIEHPNAVSAYLQAVKELL